MPKSLDDLKLLIEIDRRGSKDAVYYDCANRDFETYITSKGFVTATGSFSDISVVAPELGVAAVNLSSGYYNAHTLHEYINREQLETVIQTVIGIIADTVKSDFPKYEYIKRARKPVKYSKYGSWKVLSESVPDDLPTELAEIYKDLLDIYSKSELESYRKAYGNQILAYLYDGEYGYGAYCDEGIKSEWDRWEKQ